MDSAVQKSGYLSKMGGSVIRRNQRRWFELRGGRELYYYCKKPNSVEREPKGFAGCVCLADVQTVIRIGKVITLSGKSLPHKYTLTAATDEEAASWESILSTSVEQSKSRVETESTKLVLSASTPLVRCGTWNVAGIEPSAFIPHEDYMTSWLTGKGNIPTNCDWIKSELDRPDLICICLQEVDMSVSGIASDAVNSDEKMTKKAAAWQQHLSSLLPTYYLISSGHEASVQILLWVKKSVKSKVQSSAIAFWRGKVLRGLATAGNKGAVCIRLFFNNKTYCFIGSHLAAHPEGNEKRNVMYRQIVERCKFDSAPVTIFEHSYVFFSGDLNYRMKGASFPKGSAANGITDALKSGISKAVKTFDQLSEARTKTESEGAFQEFHEADILFYPTYKLHLNMDLEANTFDFYNIKTEAHHLPSFTDRVLYYSRDYRPTAVLRMWSPPPLFVRQLPERPDARHPLPTVPSAPPGVPKEMASVGIICLDYSVTPLHTDHRQVFALFAITAENLGT
eukprot:TRINITY_DN11690_c0_g1_i2.p1 TRINITY_DN11690_c0_g1~~TRINITY_DN11690_c0_g1_i2.p1  ORF type:complete len:509 (+),score=91.51 TRINITY_DN11690_c0_g1_i2:146-1672(+)